MTAVIPAVLRLRISCVVMLLPTVLHTPGLKQDKSMVECKLVLETKIVPVDQPVGYSIELKNVSDKVIDIRWTRHPILEFLTWEITKPNGFRELLPPSGALSPITPNGVYTLQPGEKRVWKFAFKTTAPTGTYRYRVIFEHDKLKAISPEVELEVRKANNSK